MMQLSTLGGNNGVAMAISNRGEVAGFAENSTPTQAAQLPKFSTLCPSSGKKE